MFLLSPPARQRRRAHQIIQCVLFACTLSLDLGGVSPTSEMDHVEAFWCGLGSSGDAAHKYLSDPCSSSSSVSHAQANGAAPVGFARVSTSSVSEMPPPPPPLFKRMASMLSDGCEVPAPDPPFARMASGAGGFDGCWPAAAGTPPPPLPLSSSN